MPGPSAADEPPPYVVRRRQAAERLAEQGAFCGAAERRCTLVVRLPCGRRSVRVFDACDTVASVYAWVDCLGELEAKASGSDFVCGPGVPEHFLLCVTFPRRALVNREADLRSEDLYP